jgi:glycosyltransferase involved in cell wall biosynthesis
MSITVVIPAFNAAAWLPDALNSVLSQTYTQWEAVVVNDGSTDGTAEVVKNFAGRDGRIRLLSHPANQGPAAARNLGMLASRAEYIAFLDADDIWLPTKLEKQLLLLESRPDDDACYAQFELVNDWCHVIQEWQALSRTFWHNPVDAMALALGNYVAGSASSVLIRRSLIKKVGMFNETMRGSEDLDYWYRTALHTRFCLVPEVLVRIRRKAETRLFALRRNLLGSLDFVRNARRIAPASHRQLLAELEIETRLRLCGYQIASRTIFRSARLVNLLLFGRHNVLFKKIFRSLMALGRRHVNPVFFEGRNYGMNILNAPGRRLRLKG